MVHIVVVAVLATGQGILFVSVVDVSMLHSSRMNQIHLKDKLVINNLGIDRLSQDYGALANLFGQRFFHELLLFLSIICQRPPTRQWILRKECRHVNDRIVVLVLVLLAETVATTHTTTSCLIYILPFLLFLQFLLPPKVLLVQKQISGIWMQ